MDYAKGIMGEKVGEEAAGEIAGRLARTEPEEFRGGHFGEIFEKYKFPLGLLAAGVFLASVGYAAVSGEAAKTRMERIDTNETNNKHRDGIVIERAEDEGNIRSDASGVVFVDVGGEVEKPGVYELPAGARVKDALLAAGDLGDGADVGFVSRSLNLAAPVTDGTKIYIPAENEVAEMKNENYAENIAGISTAKAGLININTASGSELEELKGIGPVRAGEIISNRPYRTIEELRTKGVLGEKTYTGIKDSVTVY